MDGDSTDARVPASEDRLGRDAHLVARAAAGDAAAWGSLYHQTFDQLYRDARYLVRDATTAEDVVQEAFAIAVTSLDKFDRRASFAAWTRGIIHNLVRRRWRSEERRVRAYDRLQRTFLATGSSPSEDPEAVELRRQRSAVLCDVLETVPASLREVFLLRDVQRLSVSEIAERLGTTPGNVRVRATRARQKIRDELAAKGCLRGGEVS